MYFGRVTHSVLVQMIDSSFYNSMSFYVNAVLEIIRGFLAKRVYIAFWVDFLFSQDQHIFGRLTCLDTKSFILWLLFLLMSTSFLRNNTCKKLSFPSGIFRFRSYKGSTNLGFFAYVISQRRSANQKIMQESYKPQPPSPKMVAKIENAYQH